MNTNILAKELAVSPKTIRRWIQLFDLQFAKNDNGHYIFTTEDLKFLSKIKESIKNGKTTADIKQNIIANNLEPRPLPEDYQLKEQDDKFQKIFQQLKIHEKKISEKADEVVSYQILVHRKEIEELQTKILSLEEKLNQFELQKTMEKDKLETLNHEKRKRKGLIRAVLG